MSAMSHHSRHDLHHHGLLLEEETSPPNYGSRSSSGGMSPKTPTRPPKLVNPVWSKVYLQLLEHIESGAPSREYLDIEREEAERAKTNADEYKESVKHHNKAKNRYQNILPLDSTRVILRKPHAEPDDSDYINANWIMDMEGHPSYIAAQAPLPATFEDWWRMIWDHHVVHIIMLTREVEGGKRKAHTYWPNGGDDGRQIVFGQFAVTLVGEQMNERQDICIRRLLVKNIAVADERIITQFHYLGWPDHGVPTDSKSLVQLLDMYNSEKTANKVEKNPSIVHCSAGIGRTGTFIVTDMVMKMLKANTSKPPVLAIADMLRKLRAQRVGMINQEEQYVFAYTTILEEVLKLAEDPGSSPPIAQPLSPSPSSSASASPSPSPAVGTPLLPPALAGQAAHVESVPSADATATGVHARIVQNGGDSPAPTGSSNAPPPHST